MNSANVDRSSTPRRNWSALASYSSVAAKGDSVSFGGIFASASGSGTLADSLFSSTAPSSTQEQKGSSMLLDSKRSWLSSSKDSSSGSQDSHASQNKSEAEGSASRSEEKACALNLEEELSEKARRKAAAKGKAAARSKAEANGEFAETDQQAAALSPDTPSTGLQALSNELTPEAPLLAKDAASQPELPQNSDSPLNLPPPPQAMPALAGNGSSSASSSAKQTPAEPAAEAQTATPPAPALPGSQANDANILPPPASEQNADAKTASMQDLALAAEAALAAETALSGKAQATQRKADGEAIPESESKQADASAALASAQLPAQTGKASSENTTSKTAKPVQSDDATAVPLAAQAQQTAASSQSPAPANYAAQQASASQAQASSTPAPVQPDTSNSGSSSQQASGEQLSASQTSIFGAVKLRSFSYTPQQGFAQGEQQQGDSNQQSILKDLLGRQSNYAAAAARSQASPAGGKATAPASAASATAEKGSATGEISSQESISLKRQEIKADTENTIFGAFRSNGAAAGFNAKAQAKASASSSTAEIVNAIQEMIAKAPSALRGSNLDAKNSLSMELSIDGLGSLKLSLERSGSKITVNVQTDSEAGKEQLSSQRQDIEKDLRSLGYKDVAVDIGSGSSGREGATSGDWRRNGSASSNAASEENVKLAGDSRADLAEILAMK